MADDINDSIAHWLALADDQERSIREGFAICPQASGSKADTYRRTAKALELEKSTGLPHCTCCPQTKKMK